MTVIFSFTIGKQLIYLVTGSRNETVILNATNYLKFDTVFLFRNGCDQCPSKCHAGIGRNGDPSCFQCNGDDRKSSDRGDAGTAFGIYRCDRGRTYCVDHYGDPADREDL